MNSKIENNALIIILEGNIDTTNAEAVGAEINSIRSEHPNESLILDASELKYISSAGLRQILRLKKANKDLKIINVNNEVYEVFDMTGFTEMVEITKAYRKVSVDGCEVIGEGSNGIVYQLNEDTIIKVYKNNDALEDIKRERELARTALVMGVNTAIPYDVVSVDDKFGSVFEMINSKSMTKWINTDPDNLDQYIKVMADLLHEIHDTPVKDGVLPDEKPIAMGWVDYLKGHIDDEHYEKLRKLVSEVPDDKTMIHGDFHSGNVHYDQNEAILIDMDTIARGNAVFEFACIYNAYVGYGIADKAEIEDFLNVKVDIAAYVWKKLVQMYYGIDDISDVENKAKVIGLTRVLRRTLKREPNNTKLIEASRKGLLEAIDNVDSLII